jgi:DNA-binding NtrC family response regulator
MPELNGTDLARQLGLVRPGIPCIFMSGYTRDTALPESTTQEIAFLQKPMSPATLTRTVRAVLDGLPATFDRLSEGGRDIDRPFAGRP